jgi:adenine-specific DNA-methyltransferase
LVWERKSEAIVERCERELPVLREVTKCTITASDEHPTNIIIEGDNYHALSVLNYTHREKIDVIYLDPPYNTGEDFIFNDKFVDIEDSFRHSKWLEFMNVRLKLAKDLLKENGVMFISIGTDELNNLSILVCQIFGENNLLGILPREQKSGSNQGTFFAPQLDYILVVSKNKKFLKKFIVPNKEIEYEKEKSLYQASLDSMRGCSNQRYWIECPDGSFIIPPGENFPTPIKDAVNLPPKTRKDKVWRWSYNRYLSEKNNIRFKSTSRGTLFDQDGKPSKWNVYSISNNVDSNMIPRDYIFGYTNALGTAELKELKLEFDNPKPVELIKYLLEFLNNKNEIIILDFFAGSGTTGHAVLELNKEDGGNRQFILCTNNENKICEEVTYQRIKKVIEGYGGKEGIAANLCYFKAEFVESKGNRSQLKKDFTAKSEDMLRIKENCFDIAIKGKQYKIFHDAKKQTYLGIFFDFFTNREFESFVEELKKLDKKAKKKIYIFSIDNFADDSLFAGIKNFSMEPIPEKILNIYKQLSREIKK